MVQLFSRFAKVLLLYVLTMCLFASKMQAQTNYAGVFNASRYVSVPNSSSNNLGSAYTIEAWVNYSGSNCTIVDKGNYDYLFQCNANGNVNHLGFYNANT